MHANAIATSIDKGEGAGEACLAVTFTGTARDYFRIWLVNLCLSLATLGVFSAWAKVRKQRYFHSHTLLDGVPFQYLGRPFAILQGRVVAATFLLAYSLLSYIAPEVAPFMLAAAVVAAPWVILRSAAFAAHFRAHRNVRFQFKSDYLVAVATLYWLGAIPVLVTGSERVTVGRAAWWVHCCVTVRVACPRTPRRRSITSGTQRMGETLTPSRTWCNCCVPWAVSKRLNTRTGSIASAKKRAVVPMPHVNRWRRCTAPSARFSIRVCRP
ncbi:MAG: DUF898 domain-containing protein [Betaproteobacteria bacterium]|nr:DUF898 domain-containing protein [Betaproteobacteria bacterium]